MLTLEKFEEASEIVKRVTTSAFSSPFLRFASIRAKHVPLAHNICFSALYYSTM